MPKINLVVLRSRNARALADFYSAIGLRFELHRHGAGDEHYAAEDSGGVFELYPANGREPTQNLRIGFHVENLGDVFRRVLAAGGSSVSAPKPSPWGLRAVVSDPDGNRVELTEALTSTRPQAADWLNSATTEAMAGR